MTLRPRPLFGGALIIIGAIAYGINIPAARVAGLGGVNGSNLAAQRSFLFAVMLAAAIALMGKSFRIQFGETAASSCLACAPGRWRSAIYRHCLSCPSRWR
jgi:hypothetical protein